jgi:hypothetical protein
MMEEYLKKFEYSGEYPIEVRNFYRENLVIFFKHLGFTVGVEVGVDMGKFSRYICENIPNVKLFCVDPWIEYPCRPHHGLTGNQEHRDRCFEVSKQVLRNFDVEFVRKHSMEAVKGFENESLDFVYIDGNHEYSYVKDDISQWNKKVRNNGIVSGHDYYRHGRGVVRAVNEYVREDKIGTWFITDKSRPSSFFWRKVWQE